MTDFELIIYCVSEFGILVLQVKICKYRVDDFVNFCFTLKDTFSLIKKCVFIFEIN